MRLRSANLSNYNVWNVNSSGNVNNNNPNNAYRPAPDWNIPANKSTTRSAVAEPVHRKEPTSRRKPNNTFLMLCR